MPVTPPTGFDDETAGWAYATSRMPDQPPVDFPVQPPDRFNLPEGTKVSQQPFQGIERYDLPSGVSAFRETVGHQQRLAQLDQQAVAAKQAAQQAQMDAQMFAQMSRVAKSTKDIEIAKRSIDVMGLQRDIQNGVPIHLAVARHPMALGSSFGSAYKATTPETPFTPRKIDVAGTPMIEASANHFQQVHAPSAAGIEIPVDTKLEVAKDPETGKRLGLFSRSGPRTQRLILDATDKRLTPSDQIRIYSAVQRGILQQLNSIEGMLALKSSAHPKHAYYVGQQEKLTGVQADLESLGHKTETAPLPAPTNAPVRRAVKNPSTGKWELK